MKKLVLTALALMSFNASAYDLSEFLVCDFARDTEKVTASETALTLSVGYGDDELPPMDLKYTVTEVETEYSMKADGMEKVTFYAHSTRSPEDLLTFGVVTHDTGQKVGFLSTAHFDDAGRFTSGNRDDHVHCE